MLKKNLIESRLKSIGNLNVRRLLPHFKQRMIGPWVFFDHIGPAKLSPGSGLDVLPHPHINLATVTYLFEGEIFHRDSLGNALAIKPGELNLMVAGSGITHSERESKEQRLITRDLHGIQLWHALPEEDEECDPAFYHYSKDQLPSIDLEKARIDLMIGEAYNHKSPVKTFTKTLYMSVDLESSASLTLPEFEELGIYILQGTVSLNGEKVKKHNLLTLENNSLKSILYAESNAHIVIIGGDKMTPRFIEWNFVSSRENRIQEAKQAWIQGRFAKVIGDEDEYAEIPAK